MLSSEVVHSVRFREMRDEKINTHVGNHPEPERIVETVVTSRAVVAEIFLEPIEEGLGDGHDHAGEAD